MLKAKIASKIQIGLHSNHLLSQQPDWNCCISASNQDRALVFGSHKRSLKALSGFYNLAAVATFLKQLWVQKGKKNSRNGCYSSQNLILSVNCFFHWVLKQNEWDFALQLPWALLLVCQSNLGVRGLVPRAPVHVVERKQRVQCRSRSANLTQSTVLKQQSDLESWKTE